MVLQRRVSPGILNSQSKELVDFFASTERKLTKLRLFGTLREACDSPHKPVFLSGIGCSLLSFLQLRWCTLFANKGKSQVLGTLKQEAAYPSDGSSTQKGTVSRFLFVLSTCFAFQVSWPVAQHDRSMRLNLRPITESNASLERKLPFQKWS